MDGGSTSSKAVLIDYDTGELLKKSYMLSKGNPIADTKEILAGLKKYITDQGAVMEVMGFGATGYAADVLKESVKSDTSIVETVAHMMSATHYFGDIDVVCDIGGQDIKVLFMQNGDIRNFRLSNQCSAGNGMLLQAMADQFGVKVTDYADVAFEAKLSPKFSYGCAVFLDSDRVNFQKEGFSKEELLGGPGPGAAQERLAVRRADPAHGRAGQEVRPAGRNAAQPGGGEGAGRLHQGARSGRRGVRPPAHGRGGRHRRRDGDPPRGHAQGPLHVHRHRRRDQPGIPGGQRRDDALPLLSQPVRPHLHRHQDARRAERRATSRASAARRAPSSRKTR